MAVRARKSNDRKTTNNKRKAKQPSESPSSTTIKEAPLLEARTEAQARYIQSIENNILTFGVGPAGVGKTHIGAVMAVNMLLSGAVEKIIITRPIQEAGERLGALPGDIGEKTDPFMAPMLIALAKQVGRSGVEALIQAKKIETLPLAYMRGYTLENCFAILDEAQNTTKRQMMMFLTRIGENCRIVVDGDASQIDIQEKSGLEDAIMRMYNDPEVGVVRFTHLDVVRSGLVQRVVENYSHD